MNRLLFILGLIILSMFSVNSYADRIKDCTNCNVVDRLSSERLCAEQKNYKASNYYYSLADLNSKIKEEKINFSYYNKKAKNVVIKKKIYSKFQKSYTDANEFCEHWSDSLSILNETQRQCIKSFNNYKKEMQKIVNSKFHLKIIDILNKNNIKY